MTSTRWQSGFSLLEVTLSIVVIGLLASSSLGIWRPAVERLDELRAESFIKVVQQAVIRFAQTSFRLPCPDTTGNGYENCGADSTGRVPYYTLGMELGGNVANVGNSYENLLYGVYRAANADLSLLIERTGDASDDNSSEAAAPDINDFRQALMTAAASNTVATEVHVTGDGSITGAENCGANRVANLAFVLISAGARDRDGDNSGFDGLNTNWSANGGGSRCAASPLLRQSANYDDLVVAVSFQSLLGAITQAK